MIKQYNILYKIKNNPKINQIRKKETESKTRQKLVKETLNSDAIGKRHLLIQIQQCKNENNVETCSKSIIKTPKRRQRCRSGVFIAFSVSNGRTTSRTRVYRNLTQTLRMTSCCFIECSTKSKRCLFGTGPL